MTNPQRFADIIRSRRHELGLSLAAVAAGGGPSEPTMVRIESGKTPPLRAPTFRKLDHVLQWPAGSARSVYGGGEPLTYESTAERPPLAPGDLHVALETLTTLIEAANAITSESPHYEQGTGPLSEAVADLRSALSPVVGRVVAAVLSSGGGDVSAARVARAVEAFLEHSGEEHSLGLQRDT